MSKREKIVLMVLFALILGVISFKLIGSKPATRARDNRRGNDQKAEQILTPTEGAKIRKDSELGAGPTTAELGKEYEQELMGEVPGSVAPVERPVDEPSPIPTLSLAPSPAPSPSMVVPERAPERVVEQPLGTSPAELKLKAELALRDDELARLEQKGKLRELELISEIQRVRSESQDLKDSGSRREKNLLALNEQLKKELQDLKDQGGKREQGLVGANDKLKSELQVLADTTAKLKAAENERLQLMVTLKRNLEDREAQKQEYLKLKKELDDLQRSSKQESDSLQQSVERSKRSAVAREEELSAQLDRTKKTLAATEAASADLSKQYEELKKQAALALVLDDRLKKAAADNEELRKRLKEAEKLQEEQNRLVKEKAVAVDDLSARFESLKKEHDIALESLEKGKKDAEGLSAKTAELETKLAAAKSDLLFATTQLEVFQRGGRGTQQQQPLTQQRTAPIEIPRRTTNDVETVAVAVEKANLRAGPGDEHSPVMEVSGGTVLTVEERRGEWLRVVSPTGGRAFIRADLTQQPGLPLRPTPKRRDDDAILQRAPSSMNEIDVEKQALERLKEAFPVEPR